MVPVTYVRPRVATGNRKHGKIHHDRCSARSASTDSQLQKSYQEARKSIESLVKSGIIDKYIIDSVKELSQEGGKRHLVNSKKLSFKNSGKVSEFYVNLLPFSNEIDSWSMIHFS